MSFIGAIIGGLLGFTFGTAIGGWLVGFIVGMLGAMVGSAMFVFLSELALALVAGLLAYILGDAVTGSQIVGLVAAAVAFGLTVVFIKEAIGVVTAIVGGLLVGIALVWSEFVDMTMAVIAMFAVMVFGAAVQLMGVREEERRKREQAVVAPPMPGRTCPKCGGPLTYIPEYNRFYCHKCQRYE
jgi:MFS family permease